MSPLGETNLTLVLLTIVGTIGAADVLYYHLYRFRLYAQPASVAEEATHLVRHGVFVALLLVVNRPAVQPYVQIAFALFALDLVNSIADVLLEKRSREPLGGIPSGEYFVHVLSTFGTGLVLASYVVSIGTAPPPAEGLLLWQVRAMVVTGVALLLVEAALFARALAGRRAQVAAVACCA